MPIGYQRIPSLALAAVISSEICSPEGNIWLRLKYLQGWRIQGPGWPDPIFDQPYGEGISARTWLEFFVLQFVSIASVTEHLWEDPGSVFSSCPLGSQREQLNGSWGLQLPQRHFCYARAQQEQMLVGSWCWGVGTAKRKFGQRAEVQKVMFLHSALQVKEMHNSLGLLFLCDCN